MPGDGFSGQEALVCIIRRRLYAGQTSIRSACGLATQILCTERSMPAICTRAECLLVGSHLMSAPLCVLYRCVAIPPSRHCQSRANSYRAAPLAFLRALHRLITD